MKSQIQKKFVLEISGNVLFRFCNSLAFIIKDYESSIKSTINNLITKKFNEILPN